MRETLRHDIMILETETRSLKAMLRRRWERPMGDEQRRLALVRKKMTDLLTYFAWSRGRLHRRTAPHSHPPGVPWDASEHAAAVAERVAPRYAAPATEGVSP